MSESPGKLCSTILCIALIVPTLTGCMTTAVWGGSIQEDGDGSSSIRASGGEALSDNVLVKILATPFALAFDICTYPIQACMYGWDDDDKCD
ncbi:MAG: hypothetical protein GY930_15165 [bacterium]|nr:hypothetical protein [bacterium]